MLRSFVIAYVLVASTAYGQTLSEGEWTAIPNSAMRSIYDPAIDNQWPEAPSAPKSFEMIQFAWGGGVVVGDELWVWGGGHDDGVHNGVFAVDALTGIWRRVTLPAAPVNLKPTSIATNPDGTPVSRHTYANLATDGEFLYSSGGSIWSAGTAGLQPREWKLGLASGSWSSFAQSPRSHPAGSLIYIDGDLYQYTPSGTARYDIATDAWTAGISGNALAKVGTRVIYAPNTDKFYGVGHGYGWAQRRADFLTGVKTLLPADPITAAVYLGVVYYPPEGKILFWNGGPTLTVLDPLTETWSTITPSGDPGLLATIGTFGRLAYVAGRLILVNGVDRDLYYIQLPGAPLPANDLRDPYFARVPGDEIVVRDCGSLPDTWETFDVRTDADVLAAEQWVKGRIGRVRIHTRPEPYGNIRVKGAKCVHVEGVDGRPIVASVNGTLAFKPGQAIRPGGLSISNLEVSPGKAGAAGMTVADCLGVPNDQTFFIVRDSDVTRCGHHSFVTSARAHHLYVEIGRSHFAMADSHLAYIDSNAMAWVYDSTFESPGWGHALRCVARRCVVERVKVSNVQLDGTVLPLGSNPLRPTNVYIGMHPLEVYTCGENDLRDVEATIYPDKARNGLFAASLRPREGMNTCDVGEPRGAEWSPLPWTSPEFHDPARWATVTPLKTSVKNFILKCVGPSANECAGWDIGTNYPFADDPQKTELQKWLKTSAFANWDAFVVATEDPALPHWWNWLVGQVLPSYRATFLKGNITNKVPLPVPVPGWFQRARIVFDTLPSLRPDEPRTTYCLGIPPVDGVCTEQNSGASYDRAIVACP